MLTYFCRQDCNQPIIPMFWGGGFGTLIESQQRSIQGPGLRPPRVIGPSSGSCFRAQIHPFHDQSFLLRPGASGSSGSPSSYASRSSGSSGVQRAASKARCIWRRLSPNAKRRISRLRLAGTLNQSDCWNAAADRCRLLSSSSSLKPGGVSARGRVDGSFGIRCLQPCQSRSYTPQSGEMGGLGASNY